MSRAAIVRMAFWVLLPLALTSTVCLYLYPVFRGCAFPLPSGQSADVAFKSTIQQHIHGIGGDSATNGGVAPFRMLALGDPQLEGDTSIPNAHRESFPHMTKVISHLRFKTEHSSLRARLKQASHDLVDFYFEDIPDTVESIRKRIDLFGNDFYLAHIYRTLRWWTKPTHVSVLGDLLGSQWIDEEEFNERSSRYWKRTFRGGERVPDDVAVHPSSEYDLAGILSPNDTTAELWQRRVINIAGNHDVGYAGDLNTERLDRFEKAFGKAAYELRFELPISKGANVTVRDAETNPDSIRLVPELRIVVINNMNLDTPADSAELQDKTYTFVNDVISTATAVDYKGHFTMVLTHIPLYKPEGICVDSPYFDFYPSDEGGTVREQFQLSADASKGFLEGIFGMSGSADGAGGGRGRPGVILNGHDHEGCDTWHYIDQTEREDPEEEKKWNVTRWHTAGEQGLPGRPDAPGLREITVRSMMGEFGGYAGLFSAWFDEESWEWKFEFTTCALGTQYIWWTVHVLDLIVIGLALGSVILGAVESLGPAGAEKSKRPPPASKVQQQPAFIDRGTAKPV